MPANLITKTDTNKQTFPKINKAIQDAFDALSKASRADENSNVALVKARNVQSQLDTIIIESGTSDAETLQARTSYDGNVFKTVKERIDYEVAEILTHISETNQEIEQRGISVKKFGVIGDGVTDDTTALQTALDYGYTNKVPVFFPRGEYKTSRTLRLKRGAHLILDPNAYIFRTGVYTMVLNGEKRDSFTEYEGNGDITIDGGIWDAKGYEIAGDGSLFAFGYARNITVKNATIRNVNYSHGVELCAIDGAVIENCRFEGYYDYTNGTRNYSEAVQLEHSSTAGFPYFGAGTLTPTKNVLVSKCYFGPSDSPSSQSWGVGVGTHSISTTAVTENITIEKSEFVGNQYRGIRMRAWRNVKILYNTFHNCEDGIQYDGDSTVRAFLNVEGNVLEGCNRYGMVFAKMSSSEVKGNKIHSNDTSLVANGCENSTFTYNDLRSENSDAVSCFAYSKRLFFENNTVRNAGRNGFNIYDNVFFIHLIKNTVHSSSSTALNFSGGGTTAILVKDNNIDTNTVMVASSGVSGLHFINNWYKSNGTVNSNALNAITSPNYTY